MPHVSPLPTTTDEGRTTTGPNPTELPQHRLVWIWLTLLCGVVGPTVVWLWYRWTLGIWYSGHGILMPWIVGYLVYERLRDDPDREPEASAWGFAFLVPSMLAIALDSAIRTQLLSAVALVTALPGFSLLLLGTRRTKRIIFPLVIAAFMLPIPAGFVAPVHLVLRELSAWGATQLVPLFGIPVHPEGTLLHLPRSTVLVADACSGFSTLYAAITTSLILVHWSPSLPRRAVLLVSAVGLSLICNTVRVVILVL
ncbi:MAG: exosortase/archaeosortase family protein, partial [Myxococcota bacterium]